MAEVPHTHIEQSELMKVPSHLNIGFHILLTQKQLFSGLLVVFVVSLVVSVETESIPS